MSIEKVDTLVVGAGQAGIAMSEHLGNCGIEHLVLERDTIAERWRSARWDSMVANGPAWHDRFPGLEFDKYKADEFAGKEGVADYFAAYAEHISAPIRCGVNVESVVRHEGKAGFRVETSDGVIEALNVVAATGPFQQPVIPKVVPEIAGVTQLHSNAYKNPQQLPQGGVLVVGAGSSGTQIADELNRAGRQVYLSVGPHERPPRMYRERDFVWWLGVLGKWDIQTTPSGSEHVTIAVSGAYGGQTIDFRRLAHEGITLLGMTDSCSDGVLRFAPGLADSIAHGDNYYLGLLDEADAYVASHGLDLPEEPSAREFPDTPTCVQNPLQELNLADAGVNTILWATGYALDFGWLQVNAFDKSGKPEHQRGVSKEPGLYFLGLPWLSRRGSSFIWGVWHDARYVADHILTRRTYHSYPSQVAD